MNSKQGIRIQRCVETLHPAGAGAEPLYLRARIHTSQAVVANIGAAQLMSHMAVGDAVNIATRLEESAKPDQIIVSDQVVQPVIQTLENGILAGPTGSINTREHGGPFGLFKLIARMI